MRCSISGMAVCILFGGLTVVAMAGSDFAAFDADGNGLLEEGEARAAGAALFARLDADHNGNLDPGELGGRLGDPVFRAADVNRDGALNAEEYSGLLAARFKSSNTNGDGAVDEQELGALPGALLLVMMRP